MLHSWHAPRPRGLKWMSGEEFVSPENSTVWKKKKPLMSSAVSRSVHEVAVLLQLKRVGVRAGHGEVPINWMVG